MKGFAITLDAVIALSFFFLAILIIGTQTYQPSAPGGVYLKQLTLDVLSVLEKTGRIGQALDGNMTSMEEVVEATPKLACMQISILDTKGDTVAAIEKSGCSEKTGLDVQTTAKSLLHEGSMYIVKSESWFRKEPD